MAPIYPKLVSANGLHLPEKYQDDQKKWLVLKVGPGKRMKDGTVRPIEVSAGDKVLTGVYGANEFEFSDHVRIIDISEVVAFWK